MPRRSSPASASTSPAKSLSETEFTRRVIKLARLNGWRVLHIRPGRTIRKDPATGEVKTDWRTPIQGDGKGFPDLLMLRDDRMVVAELKVGKGKKTPEQVAWLQAFVLAGVQDVFTWFPGEWEEIEAILRR